MQEKISMGRGFFMDVIPGQGGKVKDATTSQPTKKTKLKSLAELAAENKLSHAQAYNALLQGRFGEPVKASNGRWFVKIKAEPEPAC
jgi:hypothetical protein